MISPLFGETCGQQAAVVLDQHVSHAILVNPAAYFSKSATGPINVGSFCQLLDSTLMYMMNMKGGD